MHPFADIPRDMLEQQIERIAADKTFSRAPSLCRFLRFAVEETLQGRADEIKEYVIGLRVFDREPTFEPRLDPIVRVQARKLRARLTEYYETRGASDPVVICFPKGHYVPEFRLSAALPLGQSAPGRFAKVIRANWTGAGAVTAVLVITFGMWRLREPRPVEDAHLTQLTFGMGETNDAAISRDGRLLAYSSDPDGKSPRQIWVRRIPGGEAVQLTHHESNQITPDISPDGSVVAYRSFRDGGGIYVTQVAGGGERKIVDRGFRPKYSPNGALLAFAKIDESESSVLYVVPTQGGEPRKASAGTSNAGCAVWTPDGTGLLFRAGDMEEREYDFWFVRISATGDPDPSSLIRTGVSRALRDHRVTAADETTCLYGWIGNRLVFAHARQLWEIPISSRTWTAAGSVNRLLPGLLLSGAPRACSFGSVVPLADGGALLAFAIGGSSASVFSLTNGNRASQELDRLTADVSIGGGFYGTRTSLSADGSKLVFDSSRSGHRNLWFKDLTTGHEVPLTTGPQAKSMGILSPDGSRIAYGVEEGEKQAIYIRERLSGRETKVCEQCGHLKDWSSDGRRMLTLESTDLRLVNVAEGSVRRLLSGIERFPKEASFSHDGKWISLTTGIKGKNNLHGYLIRMEEPFEPEAAWIHVTSEPYSLSLTWSPNDNLVYFFLVRDGFRCLWAQRLHPVTKQLEGPAFAVRHFHGSLRYPDGGSWISVAANRLVMTLTDLRSNVWMAELRRLP